jgi:hypothetical protein
MTARGNDIKRQDTGGELLKARPFDYYRRRLGSA